MKKFSSGFLIISLIAINIHAQEAKYPIVKNFGGIYEIANALNPDSEIEYKIAIDLKTLQRDKESINPGLNNVARMMNLHGLGGVKPDHIKVSVIIHGGATDVILTNEAYKQRYELDNPNIPLITALKEAGAEIYVCGQSLLGRRYEHDQVNSEVVIGLSMLTVFTTYMHNGFVPLVFD